jgi:uncharacterized protein (DUF952 family)
MEEREQFVGGKSHQSVKRCVAKQYFSNQAELLVLAVKSK